MHKSQTADPVPAVDRRKALQLFIGSIGALPSLASLSLAQQTAFAEQLHTAFNTRNGAYVPGALGAHQFEVMARIVDLILPATGTPGAWEVGVHEFIDLLLAHSMLERERKALIEGLAAVDEKCRALHGSSFLELNDAQQIAVLQVLDASANTHRALRTYGPAQAAAGAARPPPASHAVQAVATLKQLTLHGYFNSEAVMRKILHTPVIPGRFEGCVPIQSI